MKSGDIIWCILINRDSEGISWAPEDDMLHPRFDKGQASQLV